MTEEQLQSFLKAVKTDATLRQQLMAASNQEEVVAIASSAGFAVTADALSRLRLPEELTLEGLESVSAGRSTGVAASIVCRR